MSDAEPRTPTLRWIPRAAITLSIAWLIVAFAADVVRPSLSSRGVVDVFAWCATQLQTARPFVGVTFVLLAFALARRHRKAAAIAMVAALVGVAPELHHARPARGDDPAIGVPLRVMSLNDERLPGNAGAVAAVVRDVDPDLIAFQQFAAATDAALAAEIGDRYPHRVTFASPPFQGIALYSKRPARLIRAPDFHADDHGRILECEVDVTDRAVRVFVVHLTSPRSASRVGANRHEVAALLARLGPIDRPMLVVGDFNAPFRSQSVAELRAAGLAHVDDRAGGGPRWTWVVGHALPIARIDHAFVSSHFGVVDSRVAPGVGSDHRPIVVDGRLR